MAELAAADMTIKDEEIQRPAAAHHGCRPRTIHTTVHQVREDIANLAAALRVVHQTAAIETIDREDIAASHITARLGDQPTINNIANLAAALLVVHQTAAIETIDKNQQAADAVMII